MNYRQIQRGRPLPVKRITRTTTPPNPKPPTPPRLPRLPILALIVVQAVALLSIPLLPRMVAPRNLSLAYLLVLALLGVTLLVLVLLFAYLQSVRRRLLQDELPLAREPEPLAFDSTTPGGTETPVVEEGQPVLDPIAVPAVADAPPSSPSGAQWVRLS